MEVIQSLAFIAVVLIIFFIALYFIPLGHWFAATISGVRISLMELLLMRLRRSPVKEIVEGLIVSTKGGLNLSRDQLEAFALSGGNINNVVNGMVAAKRAGFPLSFQNAIKADSQGLDIVNSVKEKLRETEKVKFE
ncbi:flotillin-like FloA family protein [Maribellus maritimus]|uniref:flotillin-like FloA family protein n=1 Tax=Maribellus maritimus TaxID=2870838 RepID=UPI001EEA676B|nr:flotillin-like FloA family protein [Maribellus maritimus]MCG6191571.1 flotillin-like FloA family protein [Maribellus maritimus]